MVNLATGPSSSFHEFPQVRFSVAPPPRSPRTTTAPPAPSTSLHASTTSTSSRVKSPPACTAKSAGAPKTPHDGRPLRPLPAPVHLAPPSMTHRASSHAPTIVIGARTTMGNASQSSSLDTAVVVVLRVIFARRVTCRAPSRVAPASSHAVRTKHVPLSRSVTHVKEAPPREGSRVGVGKDGARDCSYPGGPLIPDATAEARWSRVGSSPGYTSSPAEPAATTEASATSAAAASDAREARMTSEPHPRSARTRLEPRQRDDVGTENVDIQKVGHSGYCRRRVLSLTWLPRPPAPPPPPRHPPASRPCPSTPPRSG